MLDTQSWKATNVRSWIPVFSAIPALYLPLLRVFWKLVSWELRKNKDNGKSHRSNADLQVYVCIVQIWV